MLVKLAKFFLLLMLALSFLAPLVMTTKHGAAWQSSTDFQNILTGAHMAKDNRLKDLYATNVQIAYQTELIKPRQLIGLLPFRAVPLTAVLLMPLAFFHQNMSLLLLNLLGIITLLVFFLHFYKQYKKQTDAHAFATHMLLGLVFFFPPFWYTIFNGQTTILISASTWAAYIFYVKKKYFVAGLVLGLLLLKVNFLLFVPVFIFLTLDRQKIIPMCKGLLISLSTLFLLNTFLYGSSFVWDYFIFLANTESLAFGTNPEINFTLGSTIAYLLSGKYGADESFLALLINSVMLLVLFGFTLIKRPHLSNERLLAIASLATLIFNVHTMPVDLVILFIPTILLILKKDYVSALILFFMTLLFIEYLLLSILVGLLLLVWFFKNAKITTI